MSDAETKPRSVTSIPKTIESSEMGLFSVFIGGILVILLIPLLPFLVFIYLFDRLSSNN